MVDTGLHTRQASQASYIGDVAATEVPPVSLVLALPPDPGEVLRAVLTNRADLPLGDIDNHRYVGIYIRFGLGDNDFQDAHGYYNVDIVAGGNGPLYGDVPKLMTKHPYVPYRRFAEGNWVSVETVYIGTGGALTGADVVSYLVYGMFDLAEA